MYGSTQAGRKLFTDMKNRKQMRKIASKCVRGIMVMMMLWTCGYSYGQIYKREWLLWRIR